jgi:hypothetical protein
MHLAVAVEPTARQAKRVTTGGQVMGSRKKGGLARDVGLDEVADHFTLGGGETRCLRSKNGSTQLGFAV